MRVKFTVSLIFIFVVSFHLFIGWSGIFTSSEKSTMIPGEGAGISDTIAPENQNETFLIGALESGMDVAFQNLDEVKFNTWHKYAHRKGWSDIGAEGDSLYAHIDTYKSDVVGKLNDVSLHGMKSIIHRPKIAMLCYGQRSDYQCERVELNHDLWFYSFNVSKRNIYIEDISDSGAMVKWCHGNPVDAINRADTIVKRLKANTEQCISWDQDLDNATIKNWKVKPRIRIDSTIADNSANWDTKVCKIKVIGQNGDTILKDTDIKVRNFLNAGFNYDGRYLEEYNFSGDTNLNINGLWGNWGGNGARGNRTIDSTNTNKIDIQVYWYGNCDMWIDYVRVDNLVAHDLFSNNPQNPNYVLYQNWLRWEARDIACSNEDVIKFYLELFAFNNIPCMSYVSRKIDSLAFICSNRHITLTGLMTGLIAFVVPWENRFDIMNSEFLITNYVEKVGLSDILIPCYPFYTNKQPIIPYQNTTFAKIPSTLPSTTGGEVLANAIPPAAYDDWLQDNLDRYPYFFEEGNTEVYPDTNAHQQAGTFRWAMKMGDAISKAKDIPFLYNGQAHVWYNNEGESHREPTNEEMEMLANVSLTYGVRGLMYFYYSAFDDDSNNRFGRGFINPGNIPRYTNAYGQEKWEMIKSQVQRMKKWEPYIMSFDNVNRRSYIYYQNERDTLKTNTYFADVVTYKPGTGNSGCAEIDNPGGNPPTGLIYECNVNRYLQIGTFENSEPNTNHFMIVNRRCSPYKNDSSVDNRGGRRFVRVRFDANAQAFANFNNWKIINVEDSSTVVTFNKQTSSLLDLGWYLPGEGRLYKIAPVMQEGGTLAANEVVSSSSFNCNGDVYNGGKNVTINPNVTVNFAQGVKWDFLGGEFICGSIGDVPVPLPVTLTSQSAPTRVYWKGIKLSQCLSVEIENTIISYISDTSTAIQMIDCKELIVSHSTFNLTNLNSVIAIGVDYSEPLVGQSSGCVENCEEETIFINGFINNNVFNTTSSTMPTLRFSAYALYVNSLMADRNIFNSTSGSIAMFLSNVAAGNLKNNKIYNYKTGINILSLASYADLYNNEITGDSIGVQIADGTINLGIQDYYYTGGFNRITSNTSNIRTHEGYFSITEGLNTFDMNDTLPHLKGTFATNMTLYENAHYNCFKTFNDISNPREDVNCSANLGCTVNFEFNPTQCAIEQTDDYYVIDILGDGKIYDTIWTNGGGGGGGISNDQLSMINEREITSCKDLYNTICIEVRKRNFSLVHTKCMELLNNYIDSSESMDALSKLYLANLVLDSNGSKISQLKTFFETLILQNGENEDLVRKLFYLSQKCKVALGLYESAMTGFQEIINQNPYTYEGLVASWDYAATSLLDSLHGTGGGIKNLELGITNDETNNDFPITINETDDDPKDKYDRKTFTKEDRKVIKENVFNSYNTSREKEVEIIKTLETKVQEGNASESEKNELMTKRVLSEIVKAKEPINIAEHIKIVNDNIQLLFGSGNNSQGEKDIKSIIPTEYYLSQNYPNPFNPVTKISFDLPNDAKVKLIVYDLLGREIKSIVNNVLTTGKYTFEFDGRNLASGVYFYRLIAGDFTSVKRMVLVK